MSSLFNSDDLRTLAARGVTPETAEAQMQNFRKGFPYLDVIGPATPRRGITILDEDRREQALEAYRNRKCTVAKFVPASGAASRMFKDMYAAADHLREGGDAAGCAAGRFIENIRRFAFYSDELFAGATPLQSCERLLGPEGLDYGSKPKGQILFHRYEDGPRTAFEEHLVEGALYASDSEGVVRMVVTVSPEHLDSFKSLLEKVRPSYERRFGVRYSVTFTLQSPSTDTIAATPDNQPFRKSDGTLLFRPGGHGALIRNLNEVDSDIAVIKNIDNVARESYIPQTVLWKRILIGRLIQSMDRCFSLLRRSEVEKDSETLRNEIVTFLDTEYNITVSRENALSDLIARLNRPIRVCGMVRNVGEPGGGPFIVRERDGSTSLQILESVQLDMNDPGALTMFREGTHFNPVDLVCSLVDYKCKHFNLPDFVDPATGFISSKSYEGRTLKAQELPGLWNGAMSRWNTIFVEVPLITFNPVKTLFDLLRDEHQ